MRSTYRLGGYREWRVPLDLDRVVEAVWTFGWSGERPGYESAVGERVVGHRVLPHAGASLCFWSLRAPDGRCEDGELIVMGPSRSMHLFAPRPGRHIEAVRLKPEWMRIVLGIDGNEHADVIEPVTSLALTTGSRRLRDRLLGTRSPLAATRLILGYLGERIEDTWVERSTRVAHGVLERVRTDGIRRSVGSGASPLELWRLGGELGVSERQLRRVVKQETGLGPKRLQRVDRMNRAVVASDRSDRPRWSRIAIDHGYCDQSHLIREVSAFSGRSPAQLHEERRKQEIELVPHFTIRR